MASSIAFIHWDNYAGANGIAPLFQSSPLTFNSDQERLHDLHRGDRLWLVGRHPTDHQYYFVARLVVRDKRLNGPTSRQAQLGGYCVECDPATSVSFERRFPAEGLLRAFTFSSNRPVKYGASLGQSIQRIRMLAPCDEAVMEFAVGALQRGQQGFIDLPRGLWTKCDRVFSDYFLGNWRARHEAMAFLLYDPPPMVPPGAPVFIHSDKTLRLIARFRGSRYLAGHKQTASAEERISERDWFWAEFRERTVNPPLKSEFDLFWDGQNGIRGLMLIDDLIEISEAPQFKEYGRALEWGYPMGVAYRYLTLSQSLLLLRAVNLSQSESTAFVNGLIPV